MMIRKNVVVSLVALAVLGVCGPALAEKKPVEPIRVFVFTAGNAEGFTDPEQKGRADSVRNLTERLKGRRRDKGLIQVVESKDAADVTLEVLGRAEEETGQSTTRQDSLGRLHTSNDQTETLRVGLQARSYSAQLVSSCPPNALIALIPGRYVAMDMADQVYNWVKQNHDRLMSLRSSKP